MNGFKTAIEDAAVGNTNFRKVLYTSKYCQLVLMSLLPGEEIGLEIHEANDQFFRVEKGSGKCVIDGNEYDLTDGDALIVPSGTQHNILNASDTEDLKLYTIYSPPHHKDGILRATKKEAEENGEDFDGQTTEKLPDQLSSSKLIFQEVIGQIETEVLVKINSVKLKKIKKKVVKHADKIVEFESKINKLKGKIAKLSARREK